MKNNERSLGGKIVKEKKQLTKKQKIILAVCLACAAVIIVLAIVLPLYFTGAFDKDPKSSLKWVQSGTGYKNFYLDGEYEGTYAVMTINDGSRDYTIEVLLLPEYAPISVENFIAYAEEGYYDGTVFHRIVADSAIFQGGGFVYSEETGYAVKPSEHEAIAGEFANNDTGNYKYNTISHFPGVISMARSDDPNSATSEFFFVWQNRAKDYDGNYAAFGFIVDSEDTRAIRSIGTSVETNRYDFPNKPITLTKVEIIKK